MRTVLEPLRFIAIDIVWSIVYFPIWWYTRGALNVLLLIKREATSFAQAYNLRILFKFLLTPMFGQYDFWGRVLSFGVRIVHFCVLTVFTFCYTVVLLLLFLVWLILPVVIIYNLLFQLELLPSIYE